MSRTVYPTTQLNIPEDPKYIKIKQMHFNIYDAFYSQYFHQHVSAGISAIFRVMFLLQEYKSTNVASCVTITL